MWGIYDLNGDFWNSYRGWVELRGKHFKNNKVSSPGVSNTVNSSSGVLRRDNCTNSESGFPQKPQIFRSSCKTRKNKSF